MPILVYLCWFIYVKLEVSKLFGLDCKLMVESSVKIWQNNFNFVQKKLKWIVQVVP